METLITQYKHGQIILPRHDLIGYSINTSGEWCEAEVELFQSLLRPGDCVIEVGANIGSHSIPIARAIGPHGRLLCFEPQRLIFQILCGNLAINGLSQGFAYPLALGDQTLSISTPGVDFYENARGIANFGATSFMRGYAEPEYADLIRLDDHAPSAALPSLRLLKIDVEGMEYFVLRGGEALIRRHRPVIFAEANVNRRNLFQLLRSYGYRCYWFRNRYFNPRNHHAMPVNVFGTAGDADYLCVPEEWATQPTFLPAVHDDDPFEIDKEAMPCEELAGRIPSRWLA